MARLKFPAAKVRKLLEHTLAAPGHKLTISERLEIFGEPKGWVVQPDEEKRGKPGLWLVKDEGIYLMSNGTPGLLADGMIATGQEKPGEARLMVAYAKGYDPTKEDRGEVWDKARDAVGGDDFVELVPVDWIEKALAGDAAEVVITMSGNTMGVELPSPAMRRAQVEAELKRIAPPGGFIFLGIKAKQRKRKLWTCKQALDAAQRQRILASYREVLFLPDLPVEMQVKAYTLAIGVELAD